MKHSLLVLRPFERERFRARPTVMSKEWHITKIARSLGSDIHELYSGDHAIYLLPPTTVRMRPLFHAKAV